MAALPANRHTTDRNAEATVHVAHLDEKVTDALLWELMVQAGPVHHVYIPRNRITGAHFGYGFCEFQTQLDAYYCTKVLNAVQVYNKPLRISQSTVDRVSQDVGANLFIGNLVEEVDEKTLHDAFSAFGPLIDAPYIMRNTNANIANANNSEENDNLKKQSSYGFVKYGRFEHADQAIAAMNGQYICNHPISVQYAFKKDSDSRERHGSQAERVLAERALHSNQPNSLADKLRPNLYFSDQPASKRTRTTPNTSATVPPTVVPMPSVNPTPIFPSMPVTASSAIPTSSYQTHPVHQQQSHRQHHQQALPPPMPAQMSVQPPSQNMSHSIPGQQPNMAYQPAVPDYQQMPYAPAWQGQNHMRQPFQQPPHHRHQSQNRQPYHPPPHQQPQHSYPPYQQQQQHPSQMTDIGWSQGRRFGYRGPQAPPYSAQSAASPYPPSRKSAPTPVEDDQAPPPPPTS